MFDKLKKLFPSFKKSQNDALPTPKLQGVRQGILVFSHTSEVIQAERVLKAGGFTVEVKGPPPELRTGCDMVIVFDVLFELAITKELEKKNIQPLQVVTLTHDAAKEVLEPVSLFHVKDYGKWYMVRAANMKITLEKDSGIIVNISGGGCPDVPYLAARLMHKNILQAEEPSLHGKTLCSYALQKAFAEAKRLFSEQKTDEVP